MLFRTLVCLQVTTRPWLAVHTLDFLLQNVVNYFINHFLNILFIVGNVGPPGKMPTLPPTQPVCTVHYYN